MPPPREASSPRRSGRPAKRARTHQAAPTRSQRSVSPSEPPPSLGIYVEAANTITVAEMSDTQPRSPLARYKAWKKVDSALAVVYRELESVPILQTKASELEAEMKRLQQVISMQRNEMTMMQTAMNKTGSLQAEVQKLRAEAAEREAEQSEKGELQRKNRELEAKLGRAKEELEERNRTLQEWKRKLSSLIGDSMKAKTPKTFPNSVANESRGRKIEPTLSIMPKTEELDTSRAPSDLMNEEPA
ncbi:hypothetical protein RB213_009636 [Colletotrichum asianum]